MMDDEEEEGPIFDGSGKVVRIHRKARKYQVGPMYLVVYPASILVFLVIGYLITRVDFLQSIALFFFGAIYIVGAVIYLRRGRRPPCSIDLTMDSISQYEGETLETMIRFGPTVEVEVCLDRYVKDEEYGHLYGYRFSKGEKAVHFTGADDWDLWDIQSLRGPIFDVIDHHRMKQGPEMKVYREGVTKGIPTLQRRR